MATPMMLAMVITMITISRASAERVTELLDETSDLHNNDHPLTAVPDHARRQATMNAASSCHTHVFGAEA